MTKHLKNTARTQISIVFAGSWQDVQWPDSAVWVLFAVALFCVTVFCIAVFQNVYPILNEDCLGFCCFNNKFCKHIYNLLL